MRRRLTFALALAMLVALILACGSNGGVPTRAVATATASASPIAAFPQSATDSRGVKLELATAPKRIVSLSPGVTEMLYAIGAGPQVVATDRFSDFPDEAARTTKLDYSQPSAEAAVALAPDLLIMTTRQEGQVEQFRALRLPVLFMEEPKSLAAVVESARLYGRLTGHAAEGERLAASLQGRIDRVVAQLPPGEGPRVFYELTADLYTVGPESFVGSMLTTLRARNVAQGARTGFPQISTETVITANPEVILLADAGARSGNQSAATVSARPGWSGLDAVRNRRIVGLDADTVNRPGPRIVDGFEAIARAIYPDRFGGAR
jgi:iron complex transport system substrate-binding protein